MKKSISILFATLFCVSTIIAQPVSDRAVIPVAVTLNQILRLNIVDGGNVEFVFNNVADYKSGLSGLPEYQTDFNVASSTPWNLQIYAEDASFFGNDNPANGMSLDYIGFSVVNLGVHLFGTEISVVDNADSQAKVLTTGASVVLGCAGSTAAAVNCAGDIADNSMRIVWQAGTGANEMIQTSFIDAGLNPDRYTNNVFLDLITSF